VAFLFLKTRVFLLGLELLDSKVYTLYTSTFLSVYYSWHLFAIL